MAIPRRTSVRPTRPAQESVVARPPAPVEAAPESSDTDVPLQLILRATGDAATRDRMGRGAEQGIARLQRTAGNAAVARLLAGDAAPAGARRAVPARPTGGPVRGRRRGAALARRLRLQRVPISSEFRETILNERPSAAAAAGATTFTAHGYASRAGTRYQLTRSSAGVNVQVRIYFHDPSGTPLPDGDTRRGDAASMCSRLVEHWDGKYDFVATWPETERRAAGPGDIVLPVHFTATPVFDPDAERDAEVAYHSNQATGENNPATGGYGVIDAGNWFSDINEAVYPASPDVIYAHEYGHLLGIPDEYSLANPDAHARIHGAAPERSEAMNAELDRQGARQLMIWALAEELYPRLQAGASSIAAIVSGQRPTMAGQLTNALRSAWRDDAVIRSLVASARGALVDQPHALERLQHVIEFEARQNRSYGTDVTQALDGRLAAGPMETLLTGLMERPIEAARGGGRVTIPFEPGRCSDRDVIVSMDIESPRTDSALATAVSNAARESVGSLPAPVRGRAPRLAPSPTLLGRIAAMPARWRGVSGLFAEEAGRIPGRLASQAAGVFADPTFASDVGDSPADLYRTVLDRFNRLGVSLAEAAIDDFLRAQFGPAIEAEVNELVTAIETELGAHRAVPVGGGTDAAPPAAPDPVATARTRAIAAALHAGSGRARTLATAAGPAPLAPGASAASGSHIRYTFQSLMGSNANPTGAMGRPDYLAGMVGHFNTNRELHHEGEPEFRVRMRRGG